MTTQSHVDDYVVGGMAGHGLVGVLHEATFVPGNRAVVLETIPSQLAADAAFTTRLSAIGQRLSAVRSAHVAGVYDVVDLGASGGGLCVVSEPAGGPVLAAVVATEPLPPSTVIAVMCDVLAGLGALHASGSCHGELSMATVAITLAGSARVTETAVASARAGDTATVTSDLSACNTLLTSLLGERTLPAPLDGVLRRAPVRGDKHHFENANDWRAAMEDAAASSFGSDWRGRSELAERARQTQTTPAQDFAVSAAVAIPLVVAAGPKPKRRRIWRWVLAVLLAAGLIAGGVVGAILLNSHQIEVARAAPLSIGSDVAVTVTPTTGGCDTTFSFTATGTLSGSGDLVYQWERGGNSVAQPITVHVDGTAGSFHLTAAWRLLGSQKVAGTMTFHILSPASHSKPSSFTYTCQ